MNEKIWFGQGKYACRLEWGRRGARAAAERGDILVIVDVLSFSTATATAVEKGALIYPCGSQENADALAEQWGAAIAVRREEVPVKGRYSLSPETLQAVRPGERLVLQSPNGAACSRYGREVPFLAAGALVNAEAVARAVARVALETKTPVTLLACGERWESPHEEGELRFALEDYLGAGAILSYLPAALSRSPEAMASEASFAAAADNLSCFLRDCGSGIELIDRGYPGDVEQAAQLSIYTSVPVLRDGICLSAEEKEVWP